MKKDTTILIETYNNEKDIIKTLKKIDYLTRKHHNIQTIFLDKHSKDKTSKIILAYIEASNNPKLIYLTTKKPMTQNKTIKELIKTQINTENTITIEPELYHEIRNIPRLIKKLTKNDVIIPNRFNKKSNIISTKKQREELTKKNEQTKKRYNFKKILDPTQTHLAIKTRKLKKIIEEITINNWTNILKKLDNTKTCQPNTTYNMKRNTKTKNKPGFLKK